MMMNPREKSLQDRNADDADAPLSAEPEQETGVGEQVGKSAAMMSFFIIVSRITGFVRTWAMAYALGATVLASSYQVANNLPEMLYEMVLAGILTTAFLPVYMSVKQKLGAERGNEYASNILSLTCIFLGIIALLCVLFAPQLIFTQSFLSDQKNMHDAVFFFRFFSIQILFYGVSAIVSGLLNASRDYIWYSAAPILNNVVVTATFVLYAMVAPHDPHLANVILGIGNPLGIFVQMAIQIPALKKNGIKLRFRIDLKDPALMETLSIGVPTIIATAIGFLIVSIKNAAAYDVVGNGPSIITYARLWYNLPYAFLTVPITTALFTEISEMFAKDNMEGFKRSIVSGTSQILFFMVPFALYLIVFSIPLVTLYHIGAFTTDNILSIALYLAVFSISLPLYGVQSYMQRVFSALRRMREYVAVIVIAAVAQIAFTLVFGTHLVFKGGAMGMAGIALSETVYFAIVDVLCFVQLRRHFGAIGYRNVISTGVKSLAIGLAGAAAGAVVLVALHYLFGGGAPAPADIGGSGAPNAEIMLDGSIAHAFIMIVVGGLVALFTTYGLAIKLKMPESAMISRLTGRITGRLFRR
ncbi:Probable peptidoglycan biosynthesis protein MurJ [Slackia heliotrinireducens]|nr:Probable peptidoglycan biosynthesis protein MurJ [Slackia heliotrinireducens]